MGRYFIQVGGKIKGPMEAEVIVGLRWFSLDSLLCPDADSPRSRHHWRRAQTFPDIMLLRRGSPDPGASGAGGGPG